MKQASRNTTTPKRLSLKYKEVFKALPPAPCTGLFIISSGRKRLGTTGFSSKGLQREFGAAQGHSPIFLLPFWVNFEWFPVWTTVVSSYDLLNFCPVNTGKHQTPGSLCPHRRKQNPGTSVSSKSVLKAGNLSWAPE